MRVFVCGSGGLSDYPSKPLLRGNVALQSTFNVPSNIAGADAAAPRGSVSSRRGFGRPPPPKFADAEGPLQADEAIAMFKRMDLNMDGMITHAELMRGILNTPEIARRLERSGDTVLRNLVRKVVQRELLLPDEDAFTLGEWINLCEPEREANAAHFVQAYDLDQYYDSRAAESAERLANMHSQRLGDTSPLKQVCTLSQALSPSLPPSLSLPFSLSLTQTLRFIARVSRWILCAIS
jgi:hypothetical protein